MVRYYRHCHQCGKRMTRFKQDPDDQRRFYYCKHCGIRCTYFPIQNAFSEDWPREVFDEAVACGVIAKDGRVLAS